MRVRFLMVTLASALYAGAICACGSFGAPSEPLPDGSAPPSPTADAAVDAATVDGPVLADAAPGADSALVDGPPTDASKVTGRILFTTSQTFTGNLGGVAGADAVCNTAAQMGGFPAKRVFGAWLSTSASSAASRFTHDARPIKSTRNEDFAPGGWAELASAVHSTELLADELGQLVNNNFKVWTGTSPNGTFASAGTTNCDDWASIAGAGVVGDGSQVDAAWTNLGTMMCSQQAHLYCLEK